MIEGTEEISKANFAAMGALTGAIRAADFAGMRELVPAYRSVLAVFDPLVADMAGLAPRLEELVSRVVPGVEGETVTVELPVCYSGEFGIDLAEVADRAGLGEADVIAIHSSALYRVFMLGFTPGFPYLGGMSGRIATPRRPEPRMRIEAGSVGIADAQTGVYPLASPGGWNIIGRTPLALFDPGREPPALLAAGQFVRFIPIGKEEFESLSATRSSSRAPEGSDAPLDAGIEVVSAGLLSTIQDGGRYGYLAQGVPRSGAMDLHSLRLANLVLGNAGEEAGIEITMLGPELRFLQDAVFALAGGRVEAKLSDRPVPMYTPLLAKSGESLEIGRVFSGMRSYLAFAGGFGLKPVMGSLSTYARGGFGGLDGRQLKRGDRIPLRSPGLPPLGFPVPDGIPESLRPVFSDNYELRVTASHEADRFTGDSLRIFFSSTYTVTPASDRMGIRLDGPGIVHSRGADIISSGVLRGTIQVPGRGSPIILAADCQTTGGYPRIAQICTVDLPILGRLKSGDTLSFRLVTETEALRLFEEESHILDALLKRRERKDEATAGSRERHFRVEVNGRIYEVGVVES